MAVRVRGLDPVLRCRAAEAGSGLRGLGPNSVGSFIGVFHRQQLGYQAGLKVPPGVPLEVAHEEESEARV